MKKPKYCKQSQRKFGPRSEFIAALLHKLDDAGIKTWGRAGRSPNSPRHQMACLDSTQVIQNVKVLGYPCQHQVPGWPLCRIAFNYGPSFPDPPNGISSEFKTCEYNELPETFKWGRTIEITLSESHLMDALPYVVGLIRGDIPFTCDYLWDRRCLPGASPDRIKAKAGGVEYIGGPLSPQDFRQEVGAI